MKSSQVDRDWHRRMFISTAVGWVVLIGAPLLVLAIVLYIIRRYG